MQKRGDFRRARREQASAPSPALTRDDLLPRLELVERRLDELVAPKRNVRQLDPAQVQRVRHTIQAYAFCAPVLIDADGGVIDGWVRVEATRQLGLTTRPSNP